MMCQVNISYGEVYLFSQVVGIFSSLQTLFHNWKEHIIYYKQTCNGYIRAYFLCIKHSCHKNLASFLWVMWHILFQGVIHRFKICSREPFFSWQLFMRFIFRKVKSFLDTKLWFLKIISQNCVMKLAVLNGNFQRMIFHWK